MDPKATGIGYLFSTVKLKLDKVICSLRIFVN